MVGSSRALRAPGASRALTPAHPESASVARTRAELFDEKIEPPGRRRTPRRERAREQMLRRLEQTYCAHPRSIHSDSRSLAFFGVLGVLWRFHSHGSQLRELCQQDVMNQQTTSFPNHERGHHHEADHGHGHAHAHGSRGCCEPHRKRHRRLGGEPLRSSSAAWTSMKFRDSP